MVIVMVIIDPQGHGEQEEHVGEGQAEQEDAQNILLSYLLTNGSEGEHVEDQTEDKGEDVHGHQEVTNDTLTDINTH